jgi:hypothetical protein
MELPYIPERICRIGLMFRAIGSITRFPGSSVGCENLPCLLTVGLCGIDVNYQNSSFIGQRCAFRDLRNQYSLRPWCAEKRSGSSWRASSSDEIANAQQPAIKRTNESLLCWKVPSCWRWKVNRKQTFKAGQAFQEPPDVVHNFRNASTTEPAKAIGIQYAGKGQPLQVDDR